ncbi:MAG: hypothetical protein RIC89_21925 [Pseudomonadales bacterium]
MAKKMKRRDKRNVNTGIGAIGGDSWASYSDLIAGVLLIFILVTVLKDNEIQRMIEEPADILKSWQQAMEELCTDEELLKQGLVPNCETGTIELPDKVFFGFNDTELLEEGKEALRQAIPIILAKLRAQDVIWRDLNIEVRGHSDPRVAPERVNDRYEINLGKSTRRAEAVLLFLTTDTAFSNQDREELAGLAVASGASDTQTPTDCSELPEEECYQKMRRVEIHLRLDNRKIREALIQLLNQLQPTTPTMSLVSSDLG